MNRDNMVFEIPFRPPYELASAAGWTLATGACVWMAQAATLPMATLGFAGGTCGLMGVLRFAQGAQRYRSRQALLGGKLLFLPWAEAEPQYRKAICHEQLWMGYGFEWTPAATEQAYHISRQGVDTIVPGYRWSRRAANDQGAGWLHALAPEKPITMALGNLYGHMLIVGTTRSGKTRFFDNLITQAVLREEPVIIVDPKGDHDLRKNAERACQAIGHPERFVFFHPAYPETSARIDPLRNFNRSTELASRIAALITRADGGADPFAAFCWQALNTVIGALNIIGERASLVKVRRYIESGAHSLALSVLRQYCEQNARKDEIAPFLAKSTKGTELAGYQRFYNDVLASKGLSTPEIDGLISMVTHDDAHFGKMVASLIPTLGMLTSGPLKDLLSPTPDDEEHVITDIGRVIRNRQVLYIGLDSLSDAQVGTAIGALILSDLAAVAGDRYNYENDKVAVNLFADEAAEVINQPLIQTMNKGGGALMRVVIATQTVADLEARLGSKARAEQVMANANTTVALRVNDGATQKYLSEALPKVRVRQIQKNYSQGVGPTLQETYGGGYAESLKDESEYAIAASHLGSLPPLHYFAKLPGGRLVKGRVPILVM